MQCLDALELHWITSRRACERFNENAERNGSALRRGTGIGCMWYGIGNTALSNRNNFV